MKPRLLFLPIFLLPIMASASTWRVAQDGSGDFNGTDDAPLREAIERAKADGGEIVVGPGVYRIGKRLALGGVKHLLIRGEGEAVLQLAPALVTELAVPAEVGATTLTLRSPEGLRAGLKLRVIAPGEIVAITGKPKPSFETVVASVDGATATLAEPLRFGATAGTRVVDENDLNLFTLDGGCDDVTFENLTLDGALKPDGLRQATHHTRCGVWIQGHYDYLKGPSGPKPRRIVLRDCRIRNFHGRGIAIYSADDCVVENCVIENTLDEGINLDHFVERCRVVGNVIRQATVGIELNDVNDSVVERNEIENCSIGIRVWRYCKLERLNVGNMVRENRLRGIEGRALEFQVGTAENIARDNVLEMPKGSDDTPEKRFRDAGDGNRLERNRVESGEAMERKRQ